jgi:MazG family protein
MPDAKAQHKTLADLIAVMAALRTPGTGCPWDLEQTFATIAPYTIEEAYEVADAIERGDLAGLEEELGDLLLQVVYHARMAEEAGAFDFAGVTDAITRKMIRRHPHVFGSEEERRRGVSPGFWERIKAGEKRAKAAAGPPPAASLLDGVPVGLPALTRAVKLQDKAAKVGFDWPDLGPVMAKAREELDELEREIAAGDKARIAEELGDLLFVLANVARWVEADPEAAARSANAKFQRRFARIEALLAARGRTPAQSDLAEMDALWEEAKREEREGK